MGFLWRKTINFEVVIDNYIYLGHVAYFKYLGYGVSSEYRYI
jgi:hypothetical protein